MSNFVFPTWDEIISRIIFWIVIFLIVITSNMVDVFSIYYLTPIFLVTQYSSWLQHTTEHLWFARRPEDVPPFIFYASLTWGRFFGRPYPVDAKGIGGLRRKVVWWAKVFFIDLPIKLFSFMQDLSSHDFHHRSPRVNFWSISRERAAAEGRSSKYGPMTETWGLIESWRIIRDHLCYNRSDAFGLWDWSRQYSE